MLGDRLLPAGVGVDRLGVGPQLQGREPQDLPVDLQGRLLGELPEHTYEGDLVREAQPIVGAPPQSDLSSVGLEEGGIADQAGAGDVGVGDRHGSVRNKRPFWPNSSAAIDEFIEATASGQASEKRRRRVELTSVLQRGDRLVVSELLAARPGAGSDRDRPRRPCQGRRRLRGRSRRTSGSRPTP